MKKNWLESDKTYYIIFGLIIISLFLYTYLPKLQNTIVYNPEKLHYSSQNFKELFIQTVIQDSVDSARPPLIYFILHPINRYLNNFDKASQTTFFIFALISILSLFYVVSKIFSKKVGLFSSLLMMTNYYFSLMIATIEDLFLFVIISIWNFYFFTKGVIKKEKKYLWGWIITNILLVWTYYAFVYIFLAQIIFLLINKKKYKSYLFSQDKEKYFITFLILTIPIFINMIIFFGTPYPSMESFINENLILSFLKNSINPNSVISLIIIATLAFFGIYYFFKNIKDLKHQYLALILISFLITLPYIEKTIIYIPKYSFGFLWIVFIIISLSLNQIKKLIKKNK
ncbi:MAG: glycosyltransferase family 39 protein, partial [Candidatus Woesearchaeota archaeon]